MPTLKRILYISFLLLLWNAVQAQQNILRLSGVTITASQAVSGGSLSYLNDGNTGGNDVWWNKSSLKDSLWIQFSLPSAQVAGAYQLYFWNGASQNGAGTLLLYASQDGTNWTLLTSNPGNVDPVTADVPNTIAWSYYRFVFKQYVGTYVDLYEIELYDNSVSAPTLNAASPVGTQVNLSWNTTIRGTGTYELQRSANGTDFSPLKTLNTPTVAYVDSPLVQSTAYWYRIRAVKGTTASSFSTVVKITTVSDTLKNTPTLTATAGNIGSVATITWDLAAFNTTGTFQLERSTDGTSFTVLKTFDKTVKSYNDSTLSQATAYWYRVKGINYTSSSPYSTAAKVTTVSDALVNKPAITATPGAIGTVANISWSLAGFSTTGSYQLERSADGNTFSVLKTFDKAVTAYADSSLSRSTAYWYRVKGVNYTSSSPYSNSVKVTTISDSLLTAPTLTGTASTTIGTQASLSWALNIFLPGSFELERSVNGTDFTLLKTFDKTITSYTDSTLTHNTSYWYRVRGRNAVSPSPYSAVQKITTRNDSLLTAPTLQANAPTGTQAVLSWTLATAIAGNGGFQVEKSTNGTDFTILGKFSKTVTTYTEESLTPNTSYWYRVQAYNYINASPYSTIVKVTTNNFTSTPAGITYDGGKLYVSADNTGGANGSEGSSKLIDHNLTTKWLVFNAQAPGNLTAIYKPVGSYIVTGYSLTTANDGPPRDPKNWTFDGSNDSTTWVNLDTRTNQLGAATDRYATVNYNIASPGTVAFKFYRIVFTANNGATDGVRFQVGEWQIFGLDAASPSIPTALTVTGTTINSASLSWTASSTQPITRFVIQWSADGLYFTKSDTVQGSVFTYTGTGLYDSTDYYYRVQALGTTATAVSGWSNVAKATTKYTPGTPLTPINLKIGTVVDSIINMTWTDRSYNETGFRLQRSTDNSTFTDLKLLPANTTAYSDSTVWPATKYYYRVVAVNGTVSSGYSNVDSALTPGYNHPPVLTVPLLVKNACSNTDKITAYITGLTPGTPVNERTQQLTVTGIRAADTTSAKYFSGFTFTPTVVNGAASFTFTGAGYGNAGDTATLLVIVKDNGGNVSGGTDSLQVTVKVAFIPLVVTIKADKDVTSLPKYAGAQLTAVTNYPSTTPKYTWADAAGITGSRNTIVLRVSPVQPTMYAVTAMNDNGCTATSQILVTPAQERSVSNVLTPNGDGKNDTWIIWGITKNPNNSVKVFDRNGRLVFSQKNYSNNWDGRYNGKPLEEGAYYYVVDFGDGQPPVSGMLTIVLNHK